MVTQGAFDGTCGVYSIANALLLLLPTTLKGRNNHVKQLVHHLFEQIDSGAVENLTLLKMLKKGTNDKQEARLLQLTSQFLKSTIKFVLSASYVNTRDQNMNKAGVHKDIKDYMDGGRNRCVILGVSEKMEHWTVVKEVTENRYSLQGSCQEQRLNYSDTVVRKMEPEEAHMYDLGCYFKLELNIMK